MITLSFRHKSISFDITGQAMHFQAYIIDLLNVQLFLAWWRQLPKGAGYACSYHPCPSIPHLDLQHSDSSSSRRTWLILQHGLFVKSRTMLINWTTGIPLIEMITGQLLVFVENPSTMQSTVDWCRPLCIVALRRGFRLKMRLQSCCDGLHKDPFRLFFLCSDSICVL